MSAVPIVMDNGSLLFKAGPAGETSPFITETMVGRPGFGPNSGEMFFGRDALRRRGLLKLTYPVQSGTIISSEDIELFWEFYFKRFSIATEDHPILVTMGPLPLELHMDRIARIMFEKFRVPSLCLVPSAELSLYAAGMQSGLVFESGDGASWAVPIKDGNILKSATNKTDIDGNTIGRFIQQLRYEAGLDTIDRELIREMKEKSGYIAFDYDNEIKNPKLEEYEFPGGMTVLGSEMFKGPELLFKPSLNSLSTASLPQVITDSIMSVDEQDRQAMFGNIVLSGGNTMFPGLKERLQKELQVLVESGTDVKVVAPPERKILGWLGGSKLASEPSFPQMCVTKQEYEEAGVTALSKFK